jgi:catechol 2,3-dioxygenase-like lactoylglutathione lyase family enzyme
MTNKMRRQILTMGTVGAAGIASAVAAGKVLVNTQSAPAPKTNTHTDGKFAGMNNSSALSQVRPHAITMSVPNIEAGIEWYTEKLGFKVVKRKSYPEFNTSLVFMELNGYNVELIQDGNAKPIPPRPDPPAHTSTYGITQFQFRTTDLSGVKKELIAKQIPIVWEFENQELGVKFLVIRDLNANLIFFLQPLT